MPRRSHRTQATTSPQGAYIRWRWRWRRRPPRATTRRPAAAHDDSAASRTRSAGVAASRTRSKGEARACAALGESARRPRRVARARCRRCEARIAPPPRHLATAAVAAAPPPPRRRDCDAAAAPPSPRRRRRAAAAAMWRGPQARAHSTGGTRARPKRPRPPMRGADHAAAAPPPPRRCHRRRRAVAASPPWRRRRAVVAVPPSPRRRRNRRDAAAVARCGLKSPRDRRLVVAVAVGYAACHSRHTQRTPYART